LILPYFKVRQQVLFVKVVKVRKKHRSKRINPRGLAGDALDYIGRLYQIEKEARQLELDPSGIQALRQEKSWPRWKNLKAD